MKWGWLGQLECEVWAISTKNEIDYYNADKECGGGSEINYSNNDTVHTAA